MAFEAKRRIETTAKPPPQVAEERNSHLFQTIDGLHARHGSATGVKDRVVKVAAAIIGGSLLFAVLYGAILLLEG